MFTVVGHMKGGHAHIKDDPAMLIMDVAIIRNAMAMFRMHMVDHIYQSYRGPSDRSMSKGVAHILTVAMPSDFKTTHATQDPKSLDPGLSASYVVETRSGFRSYDPMRHREGLNNIHYMATCGKGVHCRGL